MSQTTLDDDELFSEAASEMRSDVESSLDRAQAALPAPETIWEVEGDNTLGLLNALRSALDLSDARDHLRDAKKWFTMGTQADAFDDEEALAERIEAIEEVLDDVEAAREQVGDLTSTLPGLKGALEEAAADADPEADRKADAAEA